MLSSLGRPFDRLAARELDPRVSLASPLVWLPVVVLCAAGFAVRLLDFWRGLWEDELTVAYYTDLGLRLVLPTVAQNGAHPPLYFFVAVLDSRLGMDIVSALRVPSIAAGVATIAVVYFLLLRLGGRAAALVGGTLTAFAPIAVWYSDEGRMYSLLWFLVLTSYLLLIVGNDSKHWRIAAVLYALTVGLALWTDYSAALALVPAPLLMLLLRHRGWFFGAWIAGWVSIIPWLFFLREQYGRIQSQRFPGIGTGLHAWESVLLDLASVRAGYAALGDTIARPAGIALLSLLAVAAVLTIVAAARGFLRLAVITVSLTAGALAVTAALAAHGTEAVIVPRVMGVIAFGFIFMFATATAVVLARATGAWRAVAAACIAVVLVCTVAATADVVQNGSNGVTWNTVADTIETNAQPGDELIYYPIATKFGVEQYLAPSSPWRTHFDGAWPTDSAQADQQFATWTAGKPRVWFVYYAIAGVDMPGNDQWFTQHQLCRVTGDPSIGHGLVEYQASTTPC